MARWFISLPGILVIVGILALLLAGAQHFISVVDVPHLAIYLGVIGLILVVAGIFMTAATGMRAQ
jgi:hypothetical protein